MRISKQAVDFLVGWESIELKVYNDSAGLPAIGIGHLLSDLELKTGIIYLDASKVYWKKGLTEEQAYALKSQDLQRFERCVNTVVKRDMTQHQYDAMVILAYNIGVAGFSSSTALSKFNEGIDDIEEPWMRWDEVKKNGVPTVSKGLTKRRTAEYKIFRDADYSGRP